jgi:6-phospho-beta-glucosidase
LLNRIADVINEKMMARLARMDVHMQTEEMIDIYKEAMHEREGSYMQLEMGGKFNSGSEINVKELGIPQLMGNSASNEIYEGYAGVAFNYIESVVQNKPIDLALNVPNDGAIAGLDDDDVVEVTCMVDKNGAKPVSVGTVGEDEFNLIRLIKRYEKLTVAAVRERSLELASLALMQHPLVGSYSLAKQLAKEYAEINTPFTGAWR